MSNEALPVPFVPPEVDLRDYQFLGIDISRLFNSEFHAGSNDGEWRAGVTLWLKSFHQVPAGSLPQDDTALTRLAELGRDLDSWLVVKTKALRGWVLCSDGRLHHRVLATKALEAWIGKVWQRRSGMIGNAKRWKVTADLRLVEAQYAAAYHALAAVAPQSQAFVKYRAPDTLTPPAETPAQAADTPQESEADALPNGTPSQPDGNPNRGAIARDTNTNRENLSIPQNGSAPAGLFPETGAAVPKAKPSKGNPLNWPEDAFEQFWAAVWDRKDKKDARAVLDKIRESGKVEFSAIMAGVASYKLNKPDRQAWKGPAAWLRAEKWADEWNGANGAHVPAANGGAAGETSIEFPGGVRAPESVLRSSLAKGYWSDAWGPRPGESGCAVPADVLARIVDPALAGEAAGRA